MFVCVLSNNYVAERAQFEHCAEKSLQMKSEEEQRLFVLCGLDASSPRQTFPAAERAEGAAGAGGGGGLLSAITGEKRVGVLAVAAAAPEITMNVYLGEYECMGRHNRFT